MLQVNPFHNIFGPVAPRVAVQMPAAAAAACRLALVLAQAAAHLFLLWGFRRELCRGGGAGWANVSMATRGGGGGGGFIEGEGGGHSAPNLCNSDAASE